MQKSTEGGGGSKIAAVKKPIVPSQVEECGRSGDAASSEAELRAILSATRHTVFVLDVQGRFLRVILTGPDLLLRPDEGIVGRTLPEVFPGETADPILASLRQVLDKRITVQFEHTMPVGPDRTQAWFVSIMGPLFEGSVFMVSHNITDRKRVEAVAKQSETRYRQLFENLLESVFESTPEGKIFSANPALVRLLGYDSEQELLALNAADAYFDPDDRLAWVERIAVEGELRNFEVSLKRKDGSPLHVLINARAIPDPEGRLLSYEGTLTDITDRKRLEAQLVFLASRDPLTNLFNRRRFQEELDLQLTQSKRYGLRSALLSLDIDRFKEINDNFGHRTGDEILAELARFLERQLREADILCRLGGDEFAILMPQVDALQAQAVASRLLGGIRRCDFQIGEHPIRITVSIGIALFPENASTADKLLAHADLAMYRAKEEGRNRFSFYKLLEDRSERLQTRAAWIKNIRHALDKDQFILFGQPVLDLRSNVIAQHELLLRMQGESGALISPEAFMDIAVKFNLIQEIDHWVIRQAIRLLREQAKAGRRPVLEVNLSPKSFVDVDLLSVMDKELVGIDPGSLIVEITEMAALSEFHHAQKFVRALKAMGCRCALDDFGVGLTSFQHLRHLPLDFLKIDGSLIQNLARNPVNQHIVQAVGHLTRNLGMKTIAECVEDQETMRLLRDFGVDFAQGFEIGEPVPLTLVF